MITAHQEHETLDSLWLLTNWTQKFVTIPLFLLLLSKELSQETFVLLLRDRRFHGRHVQLFLQLSRKSLILQFCVSPPLTITTTTL